MKGDGDGWVMCAAGDRHWGVHGAAGLLLRDPAGRVLLQHRAERSHHGGTWGVPGGARDSQETAVEAALREVGEESDLDLGRVQPCGLAVDDHGGWSYTTVLAATAAARPVHPSSWESSELRWVAPAELAELPMHPGVAAWPDLRTVPRRVVLVVDVANVMGSRPDGWWSDRLGAARRLRGELECLADSGISRAELVMAGVPDPGGALAMQWRPVLELVVEGAARPLAGEAGVAAVRAATGSGDDEVVAAAERCVRESAADLVLVVTADRELARRSAAGGASIVGPRWLLGLTGS